MASQTVLLVVLELHIGHVFEELLLLHLEVLAVLLSLVQALCQSLDPGIQDLDLLVSLEEPTE